VTALHHGGSFKARKAKKGKFHTFLGCRVPSGSFGQKDGFKNVIIVENREESRYFFKAYAWHCKREKQQLSRI